MMENLLESSVTVASVVGLDSQSGKVDFAE